MLFKATLENLNRWSMSYIVRKGRQVFCLKVMHSFFAASWPKLVERNKSRGIAVALLPNNHNQVIPVVDTPTVSRWLVQNQLFHEPFRESVYNHSMPM